jgi:hypothetical protein
VLVVAGAVAVAMVLYLALQACDDPTTPGTETDCSNGVDDDRDGDTDCADIDCHLSHPEICNPTDGDSDSDQDPDQPLDGDTDHDEGGSDSDVDADIDFDLDADGPCNSDGNVCDWSCERHSDCMLVFDTLNCCGGYPHKTHVSDEMVACVTATHRDRLAVDRCVLPWHFGDSIPTVPAGCTPFCDGASCPVCQDIDPAMRAVCHEGECRAVCSTCCVTDRDCEEGSHCVDPLHEGFFRCIAGDHECATREDCLALPIYSDCLDCNCGDITHDGLNDCGCWACGPDGGGPPGCRTDRDCDDHYFCINKGCVYMGEDSCREGTLECGPCGFCRRDPEPSDLRGHCVPLDWGDAGPPPDSGCE